MCNNIKLVWFVVDKMCEFNDGNIEKGIKNIEETLLISKGMLV